MITSRGPGLTNPPSAPSQHNPSKAKYKHSVCPQCALTKFIRQPGDPLETRSFAPQRSPGFGIFLKTVLPDFGTIAQNPVRDKFALSPIHLCQKFAPLRPEHHKRQEPQPVRIVAPANLWCQRGDSNSIPCFNKIDSAISSGTNLRAHQTLSLFSPDQYRHGSK